MEKSGFTLLEVLVALAVVSIAFAALYKAISTSIIQTNHLKEKTTKYWVAIQGIRMIQSGILGFHSQPSMNHKTNMFHRTWYWQAVRQPSPITSVELITVSVSLNPNGPFTDSLSAGYYHELPNQDE